MQSARCHLAGGEQAGHGRVAEGVDGDAPDHVVRAGTDRNPIAGQVEAELRAGLRHAGKPPLDHGGIEVREVEVDVGVVRPLHHDGDRPRHDVARRQLGTGVEVGHEPPAVAVDQVGAGAADRLRDQAPGPAGDVEHGRMELHELHVAELGAGPPGQSEPVAAGSRRIRRFTIELSRAAGGEDRPPRPDERLAMGPVPDQRAAADTPEREQVDGEGVGPELEIVECSRLADHRPHHLAAGGVAQGVNDSMMAVAPLAPELERTVALVELRAPADQFGDPGRSLADDRINHVLVAETAACSEGVGHVVVETVLGIDDARDAPLRPLARRILQGILRDGRYGKPTVDGQRRPQPGQPTPEYEHVREAVRHAFRPERNQVPRPFEHAAHSPLVPCV